MKDFTYPVFYLLLKMQNRSPHFDESYQRLLNWTHGQAPSERLSAAILISQGYKGVDPSHPLGGQDGKKDIICYKDEKKWIAGCYFPRGQQTIKSIEDKFTLDLLGVKENDGDGFVFCTNQELRLSERRKLEEIAGDIPIEIFHLEVLLQLLNTPINYGLRLEFLGITMTSDEQLAYMAAQDAQKQDLINIIKTLSYKLGEEKEDSSTLPMVTPTAYDNVFSSAFSHFGRPFHRCSYCQYGYKINNYITTSAAYITCPKCGNTEEYRSLW